MEHVTQSSPRMDTNPEFRVLATRLAKKLCSALSDSLETYSSLDKGVQMEYDKSPGHIIDELVNLRQFLR